MAREWSSQVTDIHINFLEIFPGPSALLAFQERIIGHMLVDQQLFTASIAEQGRGNDSLHVS